MSHEEGHATTRSADEHVLLHAVSQFLMHYIICTFWLVGCTRGMLDAINAISSAASSRVPSLYECEASCYGSAVLAWMDVSGQQRCGTRRNHLYYGCL